MNENQEEPQTETSSLYSSTFAQVIFVNVEKVYMTDVPVKCNYTLTPRIIAHTKDWIGIFKVGWNTARDYHTFVWAPLPKEDNQVERQQQVTFEAYYLPKDYNDFYQFCYVTQNGEIRGASTPFGFRPVHSGMSDQLDNDYSQEMLIITTQDKVEETEREKETLKTSNQKLVEENTVLKEKIKELETKAVQDKEEHSRALEIIKKDRMVLEKEMLEQKVDNEVEMKAQFEKAEQLQKELSEKEAMCVNVQKENQDLLAKVTSAQASAEQSKQEYDKAVEKGKQLQQETKTLKMVISTKETELTSLSEMKNQIANELKVALVNIKHIQSDLDKQKNENEKLTEELRKRAESETELRNQTAEVQHLKQALSDRDKLEASHLNTDRQVLVLYRQLQEQIETLRQHLKAAKEQLQLAEQRNVQTTAELRAAEADREKSDTNLHDAHQEIQHWKSKFEKMDQLFSKSEVRFKEIEHELGSKTHIVDIRTMEVADLQEEIKKLNGKIDNLRVGSNHRSGSFQLEHPNPYSLTVPKAHPGHSGLLFGNPYSECDANKSQSSGSADYEQNLGGVGNSQDTEQAVADECQKCPVCEILFPLDMEDFDFVQHVQKHFNYECPVCQMNFGENNLAYKNHVELHFLESD